MRYRKLEWSEWESGQTRAECTVYSDGFVFVVRRWPGTTADYYIGDSSDELIDHSEKKLHFWDLEAAKSHCEVINRYLHDHEEGVTA